jgi:hypothetical protein
MTDAGYSNGERSLTAKRQAVMRTVDSQGDGSLFGRLDLRYERDSDTYVCTGNKRLLRNNTILRKSPMHRGAHMDL